MYQKCPCCEESYIEDDESICEKCFVYNETENESIERYFDWEILEDIDLDALNDKGVSVQLKD